MQISSLDSLKEELQVSYTMPGEFEGHDGCILIWPERPGSWAYGAEPARKAFARVIKAIAKSETVYVAVSPAGMASARELLLDERNLWRENIVIFEQETDDAWARDVGPTFLRMSGIDGALPPRILGVNWRFNAWGGEADGLYAHWEKDDAFAKAFCAAFDYPVLDASPFVLEGGSIHSDGEGTLLTTEECLLSPGRNPSVSKAGIEEVLRATLGVQRILWLPAGIVGDETNGHVDNICAFLAPGEVALAWTDDESDPQYAVSRACLDYLESQTDAKGRKLIIHKLPLPDYPICITSEDLAGFVFEEGEEVRQVGERLAASYVNFYFSNSAVILPVFGGENEESDLRAVSLMKAWCPNREIIPIPARDILTGGGNIHCITQQIPRGKRKV